MNNLPDSNPQDREEIKLFGNPVDNYYASLNQKNYYLASLELDRYAKITKNYDVLLQMASPIIANFETKGVEIATNIIDKHLDNITPKELGFTLFELYDFYRVALELKTRKEYFTQVIEKALANPEIPVIDRARLLNVEASVAYSIKDLAKSAAMLSKIIELVPDEPAYRYNIAKTLGELGEKEKALAHLEIMIQNGLDEQGRQVNADWINYAEAVFKEAGRLKSVDLVNQLKIKQFGKSETQLDKSVKTGNPLSEYVDAIKNNDFEQAAKSLKKYLTISSDYGLLLDMSRPIIKNYEYEGVLIATLLLEDHLDEIPSEMAGLGLFDLYNFYRVSMELEDKKGFLFELADKALTKTPIKPSEKARLLNVKASIEYSLHNYPECIKIQEETIQLAPNEPAYYYNISRAYKESGKIHECLQYLEKMIVMDENTDVSLLDISWIEFAINTFDESNKTELVKRSKELKAQIVETLPPEKEKSPNPVELYVQAVDNKDFAEAAKALRKYMSINTDFDLLLNMCSPIIKNFEPDGEKIAREILSTHFEQVSANEMGFILFDLYEFYWIAYKLEEEKDALIDLADRTLERPNVSNQDRARIINVVASIEYGLKNLERSIELQLETIDLVPDESAYYYNVARAYEEVGNGESAVLYLKKMVAFTEDPNLRDPDPKWLNYATDLFEKYNRIDPADSAKASNSN